MKVIDHVKGFSKFVHYRAGNLWYETEDTRLEFAVPVDDVEGATMMEREKSATLMRWIRKHIAALNEAQKAKEVAE